MDNDVRDIDIKCRPIVAVWELTLKCDLACNHCGSRAGQTRPDELTTDEALDLVTQLKDLGVREVILIGGEAYLRDDWLVVARFIKSSGMNVAAVTGGRALTDDSISAIKDIGFSNVSVSLDALEATHDQLRGMKGSWRRAVDTIERLAKTGVTVSSNTQIARPALKQIEPLVEILVNAGINSWQASMTVPMGRAADNPHLLLEPFQVLEVMPLLVRAKRHLSAHGKRFFPGNDIGYFGPYEDTIRGTMPRGHMASCGAGRLTLGIEANGAIKGCPSLPSKDYTGGTTREYRLQEIWERSSALRFTRDRGLDELWGFCGDCYYASNCMGGCSWTAHVLFGKRGNNPFCHHRAIELLRTGKRERLVQVKNAEGKPFDYGLFDLKLEEWSDRERERAEELVQTGEGWLLDEIEA